MIRKAVAGDLTEILALYRRARSFMAANGNAGQWGRHYPPKEMIERDIAEGHLYVDETEGQIYGVFAFIIGEDPTYRYIEDGAWLSDESYGTIHRAAGDGIHKGFLKRTVAYCSKRILHLRMDTHAQNDVMRHLALELGFKQCGTIYVADGSKRIAFEKLPG